jgi:phenylpropionate dioxygenase-like ring-hydroxylating dioxygenase large terminal subunit
MITSAFILPGLFYPVLLSKDLANKPVQTFFGNEDTRLVLYRNSTNHVVVHSDICPHQGASFACGHVTQHDELVCPYHGFKFNQGKFLGIPPKQSTKGYQIPVWETIEQHGLIYTRAPANAWYRANMNFLPEENDSSFRKIQGCRNIEQNHNVVTENVLDMLHVSHVHKSFGNRQNPLPKDIKYEPLGLFSGRSTFRYSPRPGSLASFLSGEAFPDVIVQNEFYLPSTTVTRVKAGQYVKTVVTKALPQGFGQTKLFWQMYRNFGCDSLGIGDYFLQILMEKTLDEDVSILKNVDPKHRVGPIKTKYDVTILHFRKAIEQFQLF